MNVDTLGGVVEKTERVCEGVTNVLGFDQLQ